MPPQPVRGVLAVVGSAAGGVESLRDGLVLPALAHGWRVAVTLTHTAARRPRPAADCRFGDTEGDDGQHDR
ncbi:MULTISPECIES: hypothetical protein [unclassified Streptomyces]|uniref:hypothetical protein n=1 Tax=unclassified Streptomyces TaxID=2593676 RepID=UPI003824CC98